MALLPWSQRGVNVRWPVGVPVCAALLYRRQTYDNPNPRIHSQAASRRGAGRRRAADRLIADGPSESCDRVPVDLGSATSFAVLGGHVTNTGRSVITGERRSRPHPAIRGLGPGTVKGVRHVADAGAPPRPNGCCHRLQRRRWAHTGDRRAGRAGRHDTLPGVYASGPLAVTGTVTLDAQNATDAVFVLQADRLTTAADSTVLLINGANACDVVPRQVSRLAATLGKNLGLRGHHPRADIDHGRHRRHRRWAPAGSERHGQAAPRHRYRVHLRRNAPRHDNDSRPGGPDHDHHRRPDHDRPGPTTTTAGPTGPPTAAGPTTTAADPPTTTTAAGPHHDDHRHPQTTTTTIPSVTATIRGVTTAPSAGHISRASVSSAVVVAAAATTTTLPTSTTSTTKPGSPAPGIFPTGTRNGVSPSTTSTSDPPAVAGTAKPLASTGIDVAVTLHAALLAIAVGAAVVWGSGARMAGSSRSRSRRRTSTTTGVAGSATSTTDPTPAVAANRQAAGQHRHRRNRHAAGRRRGHRRGSGRGVGLRLSDSSVVTVPAAAGGPRPDARLRRRAGRTPGEARPDRGPRPGPAGPVARHLCRQPGCAASHVRKIALHQLSRRLVNGL